MLLGYRFEKYTEYALNVPMYFVYRNKRYVDCSGLSFKVILFPFLDIIPVISDV